MSVEKSTAPQRSWVPILLKTPEHFSCTYETLRLFSKCEDHFLSIIKVIIIKTIISVIIIIITYYYFRQINNRAKFSFSGLAPRLDEKLGKIEKVKGYILIRESSSLTSLNFLKNLKEISPRQGFVFGGPFEPKLYNDRYAYERLLSLLY